MDRQSGGIKALVAHTREHQAAVAVTMATGGTDVSRRVTVPIIALGIGTFTSSLSGLLLSPLLKPIARDFRVADALVGQLGTLHAAVAAAVALGAAPLLDRWPRRTILRCEYATLALGTLLSALAPSFVWLLVGRAVAGVGSAFIFGACGNHPDGVLLPRRTDHRRTVRTSGDARRARQ